MSISLHPNANAARLDSPGLRAYMDLGTGVARVRFYGGARVAVTAAPGTTLLVEQPLLKPAGVLNGNGLLDLAPDVPAMNAATGDATWARVVNGNGDTVFDCDVTDEAGAGEIKITAVHLYAGGLTTMVSGVLG